MNRKQLKQQRIKERAESLKECERVAFECRKLRREKNELKAAAEKMKTVKITELGFQQELFGNFGGSYGYNAEREFRGAREQIERAICQTVISKIVITEHRENGRFVLRGVLRIEHEEPVQSRVEQVWNNYDSRFRG